MSNLNDKNIKGNKEENNSCDEFYIDNINDFHYKELPNKNGENSFTSEFYEIIFQDIYQKLNGFKFTSTVTTEFSNKVEKKIIMLQTKESNIFNHIVGLSERYILKEIVLLLKRILKEWGISYFDYNYYALYGKSMESFYRFENKQKVLYCFTWSLNVEEFIEFNDNLNQFDKIKMVALVETGSKINKFHDVLEGYNDRFEERYGLVIERGTIRAFFNQFFDKTEYEKFYEELKKFNKRINDIIGYTTVTVPDDERLQEFKIKCKNELKQYNYNKILDNKIINANQRDFIIRNYLDNDNYLYMLGSNDFSESFISSEWYYKQYIATDMIEQTGIIVGYLKSIEQLLYQINLLSLDKGLKIHDKKSVLVGFTTENLEKDMFDTTLRSLINCLEYNKKVWKINKNIQDIIIKELEDFRKNDRNDLLHKDNTRDLETIKKIRNKALELYCLLLGSLDLNGNKFDKCGGLKEKNNIMKIRLKYWLDM